MYLIMGSIILLSIIIFDYKVKEGVSTSTNAIKLLEYVGFPRSIVKYANEIVGGV